MAVTEVGLVAAKEGLEVTAEEETDSKPYCCLGKCRTVGCRGSMPHCAVSKTPDNCLRRSIHSRTRRQLAMRTGAARAG